VSGDYKSVFDLTTPQDKNAIQTQWPNSQTAAFATHWSAKWLVLLIGIYTGTRAGAIAAYLSGRRLDISACRRKRLTVPTAITAQSI
jgi:hypothetical protein